MRLPAQPVRIIDYRQVNAANALLPQPSVLSSGGWSDIHLEVYQQPKFEIAEHQHTMHVIACGLPQPLAEQAVSDSSGERWLDGKLSKETRNTADIAIIPANISHRCNWNTPVQFMVLALEPVLLQRIGQDWVNPDCIELMPQFMNQPDALVQGVFLSLKDELESGRIGGQLLVDSLKTVLAIHLLRNYCTISPRLSNYSDGLSLAKLVLIKDYINEHLHQNLTLTEIAAIAQMSPYHFLRLFKQSIGVTPHQYILQRRIDKAKYLLQHSKLSIAEIALCAGFCDQSHLTRCFKRMLGVTPKQFLQD
ncbi:transcriptional regulator, AraC family [Gloeocapsa sp. PCC 7428]|uniref:helix-turn-helix transcriptional regulator n=1 Tax=Gloeocapsa sp. PCC 7428 TaxID=1173026 RepID=UPI0002A5FEB0|nr:AraC family transcriptional regulator [Gloeocapsa sp. PCC 7428]AFZ28698.1 transcriptional regulator, AraC family [Gloeocapsa sp. PCC 7428]